MQLQQLVVMVLVAAWEDKYGTHVYIAPGYVTEALSFSFVRNLIPLDRLNLWFHFMPELSPLTVPVNVAWPHTSQTSYSTQGLVFQSLNRLSAAPYPLFPCHLQSV